MLGFDRRWRGTGITRSGLIRGSVSQEGAICWDLSVAGGVLAFRPGCIGEAFKRRIGASVLAVYLVPKSHISSLERRHVLNHLPYSSCP